MTRNDMIRMAREAGCIPVRHPAYDNDVCAAFIRAR
jgi:hypothetical protein